MFEVVQFRNKIYFFAHHSHASHKFSENYYEGFEFLPSVDLLRKRCKVEKDGRWQEERAEKVQYRRKGGRHNEERSEQERTKKGRKKGRKK